MTTPADMIVGGTAGTPQRVGIGEEGDILQVVGGVPTWAAPTGEVPGGGDEGDVLTIVDGEPAWAPDAGALPAGTDAQTLRWNGTTPEASSILQNDGANITVAPADETGNNSIAGISVNKPINPSGGSTGRVWGLFGRGYTGSATTGDFTAALPPLIGVEGRIDHNGAGAVNWGCGVLGYAIADITAGSGSRVITEAVGVMAYGNRVFNNGTITRSYEVQATLKNSTYGGLLFGANNQHRVGVHICGDVPDPGAFTGTVAAAVWFNSDVHAARNGLTWGATAADRTNLYQSASQTLKTDGNLVIAGTLSALLGIDIEVRTSDPGAPRTGQLWYRSDTNQLSIYTGAAIKRVAMA
jgi:hypothetical protein